MNSKPVLVFSALAAAAVGALGMAYYVAQHNLKPIVAANVAPIEKPLDVPAVKVTEGKKPEVAAPEVVVLADPVKQPEAVTIVTPVVKPNVVPKVAAPVIVPPKPADTLAFDTVRIEKTGEAIVAGRAEPGAKVTLKWNGKVVGTATANTDGSFALVPEKPLAKGTGALTLEIIRDGETVQSEGSVIVAVNENAPVLVAKIDPVEPTAVIQVPASPGAPLPTDVQLNAVDYDTAGNIVFSGRAAPDMMIRFYVDNKLFGEVPTTVTGLWSFKGDARVLPGQHVLRADAVAADGKVKSRIELPFLRESVEVAAAAKTVPPVETAPPVVATEEIAVASAEKTRSVTIEKVPLATDQSTELKANVEITPTAPPVEVAATVEPELKVATPKVQAVSKLVIQPGNSLWKLSRQIYGKGRMFTVIYEANRDQLRNPNRIYPGQILTAPAQK